MAVVLAVVGLVLAYTASQRAIGATGFGEDFWPSRGAAEALLHGRLIYADSLFVYPPTAAVAFLPTTLLGPVTALHVWLYLEVLGLIFACYLATYRLGLPWSVMAGGLATCILMKGDLLGDNLWLANPSLFLAPVVVGVVLCFEDERWTLGCALLVASLLVKPLLIALLLVPILRRQWQPLLVTVLPAALMLVLAVALIPGADRVGHVLSFLASGSTLEGHVSIYYNLSLQALGRRLGAGTLFLVLRILVLCAALLSTISWWRDPEHPGHAAAIGTVLISAVLLAGRLSEGHYVIVVALCLLVAVVLRRDWSSLLAAAPAILVMFVPRYYLGGAAGSPAASQVRYTLVEVLLFAAAAWMVWRPATRQLFRSSVGRSRSIGHLPGGL